VHALHNACRGHAAQLLTFCCLQPMSYGLHHQLVTRASLCVMRVPLVSAVHPYGRGLRRAHHVCCVQTVVHCCDVLTFTSHLAYTASLQQIYSLQLSALRYRSSSAPIPTAVAWPASSRIAPSSSPRPCPRRPRRLPALAACCPSTS
jgi:uncharacterized protein YhhL (DUF1145 family)